MTAKKQRNNRDAGRRINKERKNIREDIKYGTHG